MGPEGLINMAADIRGIADEVFATIGTGHQIAPFTKRPGGLSLGEAYRVTALLNQKHEARGENAWGGRSDLLTAQFGSNTRFMSRFGVTFMIPRCMS
jgi:hypothetical protein